MYLAYIDDSDTRSKEHKEKLQVMSAVMIRDDIFHMLEFLVGVAGEGLIPEERREEFVEFKACELFGGYGVFQGVDQDKRMEAIKQLLSLLDGGHIPVIYGAVNLEHLSKTPYGSANPKDIAFRICAHGIETCLLQRVENEPNQDMALLIADECEGNLKKLLQHTFRGMRHRVTPPAYGAAGELYQFHDDMYFGDSRYSVGLQVADLCSYFITRHLCGDVAIKGFYDMIEPHIRYHDTAPGDSHMIPVRHEKTLRQR